MHKSLPKYFIPLHIQINLQMLRRGWERKSMIKTNLKNSVSSMTERITHSKVETKTKKIKKEYKNNKMLSKRLKTFDTLINLAINCCQIIC